MKTQTVTDVYDREVEIAVNTKKVYLFNNKIKEITYSAQIVENGELTQFWTDFKEEGVVTDIETKIKAYGNVVAFLYAQKVGFDSETNDPDKKIWKEVVKYVEENQSEFFTKAGDWKKRICANPKKGIIEIKRNV